ncbi:hypothetical protein BC940DRAFT_316357 [Gongronella butleri]|nr:hypothetical protein BC940DRAFT_316357 [Gongronella butleri]
MTEQQQKPTTTEAANGTASEEATFWTRVASFPLVQDASQKVTSLANQNSLSRYALQQAGTTLNKASELASPYAEPYIKQADALGCRSLDLLEQRFPAAKQTSTDDLIQAVKQSPQQVLAPVNKHMLTAADSLETLVNKYLPPTATQEQRKEQVETFAAAKFYHLANDVKTRLQERVSQQFDQIPRTRADITRLTETNQILKETVGHVQAINTQLVTFVNNSRAATEHRVQGVKESLKSTQEATNQRLHELTVELFNRLDAASTFLKENSVKLPESVQTHLAPLVEFASHEYNIIRTEATKEEGSPLQKANAILTLSSDYILPYLKSSSEGIQQQLQQYMSLINKPAATPAEPAPAAAPETPTTAA